MADPNPSKANIITTIDKKLSFEISDATVQASQKFDLQEAVNNSAAVQLELETARRLSKKRKRVTANFESTKRMKEEFDRRQVAEAMQKVTTELKESNEKQIQQVKDKKEEIAKMRAAMGLDPEPEDYDSDSSIELLRVGERSGKPIDIKVKEEKTE